MGRVMTKFFKRLISEKDGATAIEYALIASGIALAIVTVVFLLGDTLLALYNDVLVALTA